MNKQESLDRLEAMVDDSQRGRDLSPNDIAAIKFAIEAIKQLGDCRESLSGIWELTMRGSSLGMTAPMVIMQIRLISSRGLIEPIGD